MSNSGTRALGHSTLQVLDPSGAQRHRGDHEQVGFTEAFGDGLLAQFMLLRWALTHKAGGRDALAVYLKSVSRGWDAEAQANAIRAKTNPSFEHAIKSVTADLHAHATPDLNLDGLHEVLRSAHQRLGFPRGGETWDLANAHLRRSARVLAAGGDIEAVALEVERVRVNALVGFMNGRAKPVRQAPIRTSGPGRRSRRR